MTTLIRQHQRMTGKFKCCRLHTDSIVAMVLMIVLRYLKVFEYVQATVTTGTETESCVGLATNFKERFRNHTTSFRHVNKRNSTELSKHVWKLKDAKKPFNIAWKVLRKCTPYNNITKKCSLCLYETFVIICRKDL